MKFLFRKCIKLNGFLNGCTTTKRQMKKKRKKYFFSELNSVSALMRMYKIQSNVKK